MIVEIQKPFFSAEKGTKLKRIEGTIESQVCDVCGKKKPCDWYIPIEKSSITGMDICRSCARSLEWFK